MLDGYGVKRGNGEHASSPSIPHLERLAAEDYDARPGRFRHRATACRQEGGAEEAAVEVVEAGGRRGRDGDVEEVAEGTDTDAGSGHGACGRRVVIADDAGDRDREVLLHIADAVFERAVRQHLRCERLSAVAVDGNDRLGPVVVGVERQAEREAVALLDRMAARLVQPCAFDLRQGDRVVAIDRRDVGRRALLGHFDGEGVKGGSDTLVINQ